MEVSNIEVIYLMNLFLNKCILIFDDFTFINTKKYNHYRIGQKLNMKNDNLNPGVGMYEINPRIFDGPKYSLSKAKDISKLEQKPGPFEYSPNKTLFAYPKWSMRKKHDDKDNNLNPGPGMYSPKKNFKLQSYRFPKDDRLKNSLNEIPAPNMYSPKKMNLKKSPIYSIRKRYDEKDRNENPGPNMYNPNMQKHWKNTM